VRYCSCFSVFYTISGFLITAVLICCGGSEVQQVSVVFQGQGDEMHMLVHAACKLCFKVKVMKCIC
jgi:hypothetical protein